MKRFGLFLLVALGCAFFAKADAAKRPNIIFLLTDDQRWDTLGSAGNKIIATPNIDSLAKRGTVFRNAFVTTAICSVSRASIFSGQYERRHGIDDFGKGFSAAAWSNTYPALLKQNGYRTGFIGKFGVGNKMPTDQFDYWKGFAGQGKYLQSTNAHLTSQMGDSALEFLQLHGKNGPFCLSISFKAPHAQDKAPREFPPDARDEQLYANATIPFPKTGRTEFFETLPDFIQKSEGHTRWEGRYDTPERFQNTVKDYYRLVSGVDREVGRIMAALRDRGIEKNTIIIFTSDNGAFLGERGMADKWLMYEESIRVPMIVFDPRATQKQEIKEMALNIDLALTILDYAGISVPDGVQGKSLRPLAEGKRVKWRDDWFYEHHFAFGGKIPPSEGVRNERWKYIRYVGAEPVHEELYDLKKDPREERNLAGERAQKKTLEALRSRWTEYRTSLN